MDLFLLKKFFKQLSWGALIALALIGVAGWIFLGFVLKKRETAHFVRLPPDYKLIVRGRVIDMSVESAFSVSSYGGLHGDGASLTAYRIKPSRVLTLIEEIKASAYDYIWEEMPLGCTGSIFWLSRLLSVEFSPNGKDVLLHGRPAGGDSSVEYFVDRGRAVLYVIIIQY